MPVTVFTAKVIGTVSIGLWAGYNLSFVPTDVFGPHAYGPAWWLRRLLSRADGSAKPVRDDDGAADVSSAGAFSATGVVAALSRALTASAAAGVVCAANVIAYTLSNSASKHPYLLYIALGAPLVGALQLFGARELSAQIAAAPASSEVASELSESTYEHVSAPGHTLSPSVTPTGVPRVALHSKYTIYSGAVAGLSTLLCTISVIGLAGDTTVQF